MLHRISSSATEQIAKGLPETPCSAQSEFVPIWKKRGFHDVILIAEAFDNLAQTKAYFGQGDECHMAYHFGLAEQMWLALAKGDTAEFKKMLEASQDIPENCQWAIFLRNHDEIALGQLGDTDRAAVLEFLDPGKRYLMQKANLTSMRIAEVFGGDDAKIRAALKMLYDAPGAHVMYYGDEIGMRNLAPQEGIVDTRKFVRGAFDRDLARSQMQDPDSLFNDVAKLMRTNSAEIVHAEDSPSIGT